MERKRKGVKYIKGMAKNKGKIKEEGDTERKLTTQTQQFPSRTNFHQ
jgi:hypothetical protein